MGINYDSIIRIVLYGRNSSANLKVMMDYFERLETSAIYYNGVQKDTFNGIDVFEKIIVVEVYSIYTGSVTSINNDMFVTDLVDFMEEFSIPEVEALRSSVYEVEYIDSSLSKVRTTEVMAIQYSCDSPFHTFWLGLNSLPFDFQGKVTVFDTSSCIRYCDGYCRFNSATMIYENLTDKHYRMLRDWCHRQPSEGFITETYYKVPDVTLRGLLDLPSFILFDLSSACDKASLINNGSDHYINGFHRSRDMVYEKFMSHSEDMLPRFPQIQGMSMCGVNMFQRNLQVDETCRGTHSTSQAGFGIILSLPTMSADALKFVGRVYKEDSSKLCDRVELIGCEGALYGEERIA